MRLGSSPEQFAATFPRAPSNCPSCRGGNLIGDGTRIATIVGLVELGGVTPIVRVIGGVTPIIRVIGGVTPIVRVILLDRPPLLGGVTPIVPRRMPV